MSLFSTFWKSGRKGSDARSGKSTLDRTFSQGEHWIWLTGAALAIALLMIAGLLLIVVVNGAGVFWPHRLTQAELTDGTQVLGVVTRTEEFRKYSQDPEEARAEHVRSQFRVGNRDLYGLDFRWIEHASIAEWTTPSDAVALEREEYGDFYGFLEAVKEEGRVIAEGPQAWEMLRKWHPEARRLGTRAVQIQKHEIGALNAQIRQAQLQIRRAERRLPPGSERDAEIAAAREKIARANELFEKLKEQSSALQEQGRRHVAVMRSADGQQREIPLIHIVRPYRPNQMGVLAQAGHYASKVWEFVSGEPRESNTEGGILPAIFGTVLMTLLMSVAVVPFGVLAAFYLREYARQGLVVRCVRIAVNNLAGVPSIVFGVFGLGFFIYFVGGTIDQLFYPEALPTPTYGTGGIFWASLTLALLTVPVVIVATEESIAAVPRGAREGSLALGASRFQTMIKIVLPASLPGILTGLILAMARGAGEVAPLMITGVVKLAPELPLDWQAPFIHLDRKFMHLGFHIYDVGFQSPNVEAAKPMVFATALLLLLVVAGLNITAIFIRDRVRKKYRAGAFA
jgi:phosphate transport system permease protein